MAEGEPERWVAGVDGCRSGWVAAMLEVGGRAAGRLRQFARFEELLTAPEAPLVIAVDMPIGLPERTGAGGRGPECAVRPLLGGRQSSVFSVPAREVVMADDYAEACRIALERSDPPRKVSKQCFNLFPKIREIDSLMTPELEERVYEVHPELAFWRLNGERAMALPKKVKSRPHPPGLAERRALLEAHGMPAGFLAQPCPAGVGADDLIDACANALIGLRILEGRAHPFPAAPARDARGLRIAIWA